MIEYISKAVVALWFKFQRTLGAKKNKAVAIRIVYGQSNALGGIRGGARPAPVFRVNPWPSKLWMPNTGIRMGLSRSGQIKRLEPEKTTGFMPLVSEGRSRGGQSTTIGEGASWQICAYWARTSKKVPKAVLINLAWGGKSINSLSPGSVIYEDGHRAIDRVCTLLESHGLIPYVEYVDFDQGEADSCSAEWGDAVVALRESFNADIKSRTKQNSDIPWLLAQPSSFLANCDAMVRSQYDLCKSRPKEFIQSGPSYHLPFLRDLLHRQERGHAIKGEFNGLCVARTLYQQRENPVLQWESVEYDELMLTIRLTPSISVTRDKAIKDPGNWGFNVYNGKGQEISIQSVKTTGKGRHVVLKMSAAVTPGLYRCVDYAINSRHRGKRTRYDDRPRGQIRTRNPFGTSYLSRTPIYGYMPHSRVKF